MSQIKKRTFSLPQGLSDFIDSKVESGNYANSSEVVRAGLRALQDADYDPLKKKLSPKFEENKQSQHSAHPINELYDEIRSRNKSAMDGR